MSCCQCVRSYHNKCVKVAQTGAPSPEAWVCPECVQLTEMSSSSNLSVDQLSTLLMFAWNRMTQLPKVRFLFQFFFILSSCWSRWNDIFFLLLIIYLVHVHFFSDSHTKPLTERVFFQLCVSLSRDFF